MWSRGPIDLPILIGLRCAYRREHQRRTAAPTGTNDRPHVELHRQMPISTPQTPPCRCRAVECTRVTGRHSAARRLAATRVGKPLDRVRSTAYAARGMLELQNGLKYDIPLPKGDHGRQQTVVPKKPSRASSRTSRARRRKSSAPSAGRNDLSHEGKAQQDKADAQRDVAKKEAEAEAARAGAAAAEKREEGSRARSGAQPTSE